jgi:hypothetical protein
MKKKLAGDVLFLLLDLVHSGKLGLPSQCIYSNDICSPQVLVTMSQLQPSHRISSLVSSSIFWLDGERRRRSNFTICYLFCMKQKPVCRQRDTVDPAPLLHQNRVAAVAAANRCRGVVSQRGLRRSQMQSRQATKQPTETSTPQTFPPVYLQAVPVFACNMMCTAATGQEWPRVHTL